MCPTFCWQNWKCFGTKLRWYTVLKTVNLIETWEGNFFLSLWKAIDFSRTMKMARFTYTIGICTCYSCFLTIPIVSIKRSSIKIVKVSNSVEKLANFYFCLPRKAFKDTWVVYYTPKTSSRVSFGHESCLVETELTAFGFDKKLEQLPEKKTYFSNTFFAKLPKKAVKHNRLPACSQKNYANDENCWSGRAPEGGKYFTLLSIVNFLNTI